MSGYSEYTYVAEAGGDEGESIMRGEDQDQDQVEAVGRQQCVYTYELKGGLRSAAAAAAAAAAAPLSQTS